MLRIEITLDNSDGSEVRVTQVGYMSLPSRHGNEVAYDPQSFNTYLGDAVARFKDAVTA